MQNQGPPSPSWFLNTYYILGIRVAFVLWHMISYYAWSDREHARGHETQYSTISFKHVGSCCLFLDSHLTTRHSTIGVQFIYGNKLGWLTLGIRKHYHDFLYSERSIATYGTHASDRW